MATDMGDDNDDDDVDDDGIGRVNASTPWLFLDKVVLVATSRNKDRLKFMML